MAAARRSRKEQLLTVKEAADLMRVSHATIYAWVRKGDVAAFKVGHTIRISPDALKAPVKVRNGERNALARLAVLVQPEPDGNAIDELEKQAREREAKEPPHHGEAQVLAFGREDSRVR